MEFSNSNKLKQGKWVAMVISSDNKKVIGVSKRFFFYDTALRYAEAIVGFGSDNSVVVTTYDVYLDTIKSLREKGDS